MTEEIAEDESVVTGLKRSVSEIMDELTYVRVSRPLGICDRPVEDESGDGNPPIDRVRRSLAFTAPQMKVETVEDRDALEQGFFKTSGGYPRLDEVFDGKLADVLGEMLDAVWSSVS
jgi:hypothetical protein